MVHFSRAGIDELGNDPRSTLLMAMTRNALPNSNWFIMNVLNVPPRNNNMEEMKEGEMSVEDGYVKQSVGWHKGLMELCMNDVCATFCARAVQVLYISVPSDMGGGELVFHMEGFPEHQVTPQDNMLVKFDGRMIHSVNPFSSPSNEHRISLVLESYVLPPSWLETVPDLEYL